MNAIFPFIGFTPYSDIFDADLASRIELDDEGHIKTDDAMRTSVPGIFAAGDATTAALAAHQYVEKLKHVRSKQTA